MAVYVGNLKVQLQVGTDNTYYASWDFPPSTSSSSSGTTTTTSTTIKVGTLVKVKSGAKSYNGVSLADFVYNDEWYVYAISGNRVVINKNKSGTNSIMTPVHKNNLTVVSGGGSSSSSSSSSSNIYSTQVEHYEVEWQYFTGDGVPFTASETTTKDKNSVYDPPEHATTVKVWVKPVSKTYKKNGKDTTYWTGGWDWAEIKTATAAGTAAPPDPTSEPTVVIEDYTLTATVSVDTEAVENSRIDKVQFEVYNGNTKVSTGTVEVLLGKATYVCTVAAGGEYYVRYRYVNVTTGKTLYSSWSDLPISGDKTIPSAVTNVKCAADSKTSIKVTWSGSANAESYEVQYTTNKAYFDSSGVSSETVTSTTAYITGLDSGDEWFFRVRAVNDQGNSGWSSVVSTLIGTKPAAPTTWSLSNTAYVGEEIPLYWVHNTEDGSYQTEAEILFTIDGVTTVEKITTSADEEEEEPIYTHILETSDYPDGGVVLWKVRTKGIIDEFSDWSTQREINIFAPPTLTASFETSDGTEGEVGALPFEITATAGPENQTPVRYFVSIVADESYISENNMGNEIFITAGTEVYSKVFDVYDHEFSASISAGDVTLENGRPYTLTIEVAMDSGLSASVSMPFTVNWEDRTYIPEASIGVDYDSLYTFITPFCMDEEGNLIENVTLGVYRREYDGRFTEIGTGLANDTVTTVTDPHPALDYARYRIVVRDEGTGRVTYEDLPGYPIGETAIVMQWDEKWVAFNHNEPDSVDPPSWVGSMLKLPYNVDVSENHNPDVSLIEYIGRENPVSYYGTQRGETATWSTEIPKEDKETLYALRRLAAWQGDVYVREPSGVGYWAHVNVSHSIKHLALTIPINFEITRVEGGVR